VIKSLGKTNNIRYNESNKVWKIHPQ